MSEAEQFFFFFTKFGVSGKLTVISKPPAETHSFISDVTDVGLGKIEKQGTNNCEGQILLVTYTLAIQWR